MTRVKESPGVARLRVDESRARPTRGRAFIAPPSDPFLTPDQEQALFVDLKRQGKLRAKQGFGDVRPFLDAYKAAVLSSNSHSSESASGYLVVQLEPDLHTSRITGIYANISHLPGVVYVVRGDFDPARREVPA